MKRKRKQLKTELYNTILHNQFKATCAWIKKKVNGIQKTVRQRHSGKLLRDKIDLHSKNIQENDLRTDVSQKTQYQQKNPKNKQTNVKEIKLTAIKE